MWAFVLVDLTQIYQEGELKDLFVPMIALKMSVFYNHWFFTVGAVRTP